jgi:hypothetical protein
MFGFIYELIKNIFKKEEKIIYCYSIDDIETKYNIKINKKCNYIPFDISVLLKLKGYNKETIAYYLDGEIFININNKMIYPRDFNVILLKGKQLYSAPLWNEVFEWLNMDIRYDISIKSSYYNYLIKKKLKSL